MFWNKIAFFGYFLCLFFFYFYFFVFLEAREGDFLAQPNTNLSVFRENLFSWRASLTIFDKDPFSRLVLHTLNFFNKLYSICNNWTIFVFLLSNKKILLGLLFLWKIFFTKNIYICRHFAITSSRQIFLAHNFSYAPSLVCR